MRHCQQKPYPDTEAIGQHRFLCLRQKEYLARACPDRAGISVELFSWEGIGRYHNHTIGVPNGNYLYTVYKSIDSREATLTHGVNIEKNGNFLADLVCDPATVKGDLEGWVLELKGE